MIAPPHITVLMPVRAYHAEYLREAVDSLLGQSSPEWRLLIVADGPSRRELAGVLEARCDDPRVELVDNAGRQLAGALNTGMRLARTEFAAILFGDDLWEPEAVEVLTRAIRAHPEVDFFHSSQRFVGENGSPISDVIRSRTGITLASFGPTSPVRHLMCWRISTALSFEGMDESLNSVGPDDFDFPWAMAEHGALFRDVPECLYVVRDHRTHFRLTTHLPRSVHIRETRRILRKHGMPRLEIERFVYSARRSYLRQCVYRSRADRFIKERLGLGETRVWREQYQNDRVHLVEVGLTWPPDSFLRDKLAALAQRGLKITVLATPGSPCIDRIPGVELRLMPELRPPLFRGVRAFARDVVRLCVSNPILVPRAARTVWRAARGRGPRTWFGWTSLIAHAAELEPDVVHFEWESSAVRYLQLAAFWRCPMTMSCHGGLDLYASSPTHARALDGLPAAFKRATAVHCVSEAIRDEAVRHGLRPGSAVVIRTGVDLDLFIPAPKARDRAHAT